MKIEYESGRRIWYDLLGQYGETKAKKKMQDLYAELEQAFYPEYKCRISEAYGAYYQWEQERGIRILKDIEGKFGKFVFKRKLYRDVFEQEYGKEAIQGLIACRLAEPCGSLNGRKLIKLKEIEGI